MSRYFNGQEVELLAPAGNFEIFKDVINTGADAVYFGGKNFNMRMHRKDFNFSNEEIELAIEMAHKLGKRVYITVNNLMSYNNLKELEGYLRFLEKVGPDALIVQDMSIIALINQLQLKLQVHASVMMNVHNVATISALREVGVTRVVASREMSLASIKEMALQTDMEFEYFVHGDMCIAHGSQCLYSGMLFGKSSNRGRCMKPCRWAFNVEKDGKLYKTSFPMAVKDMAMYEHLPELIEAGIVSFKIEGRMRDSEYLCKLINFYSDAINRYIEDPICYNRSQDQKTIYETRKRDLSTAYAFGNQGLNNINERYEGTGKFYSTGKVFSKPTPEIPMEEERIKVIKNVLAQDKKNVENQAKLAAKVNDYEAAEVALEEGVDVIYLSGDVYEPAKPFSKEQIKALTAKKGTTKIYLGLPRMMFEKDFSQYDHYLKDDLGLDGLLVTQLGAVAHYKDLELELVGDYALNIYNATAADFYKNYGVIRGTLSLESPLENTKEALTDSALPLEVVVQGAPSVMYLEHDLFENIKAFEEHTIEKQQKKANVLYLVDDKDTHHPVYRDARGKNHLLLTKELCYLPFIKELGMQGVSCFRIEGCHYEPEELRQVIKVYKQVMMGEQSVEEGMRNLHQVCSEYTLGAMQFD